MTMRAVALSLVLLTTCIAGRGAHAQLSAVKNVDPAIETVVSGGVWTTGTARGRYRIVVVMEGWETIRHRAVLQWLTEPGSPDAEETVTASVDLTDEADVFSLGDPVMSRRGGRWYVSLRAAKAPLVGYSQRITFELGPPRKVRRADQ